MGAPIRKALKEINEDSKEDYTLMVPYRPVEKYWIKKSGDTVVIYFSIHFSETTDQALARIMCGELKDSKKISSQAATVAYYQKESQHSDLYSTLGMTQKDASVGILSITMTKIQVKKNLDTATYFLTTFRQYMEYHVRMMKSLLHTKMRNRIVKFEIVFEKALREGVTSKMDYKTTIGGKQISDKTEEEKVSVLSTKKKYDEDEYTIG